MPSRLAMMPTPQASRSARIAFMSATGTSSAPCIAKHRNSAYGRDATITGVSDCKTSRFRDVQEQEETSRGLDARFGCAKINPLVGALKTHGDVKKAAIPGADLYRGLARGVLPDGEEERRGERRGVNHVYTAWTTSANRINAKA
eukprot:438933-Prorocentrum_minimum.AAC.4